MKAFGLSLPFDTTFGLLLLAGCGLGVVALRDRRALLAMLLAQIVLLNLFYQLVLPSRLAAIKLLAGLGAWGLFALTAWQTRAATAARTNTTSGGLLDGTTQQQPALTAAQIAAYTAAEAPEYVNTPVVQAIRSTATRLPAKFDWQRRFAPGLMFRLLAGLLVCITAQQLASQAQQSFNDLPLPLFQAVSFMVTLGLLTLGLTEEPFKTGLGLLAAWNGFQLFYVAVEPALAVFGLLAAIDLGIALSMCYLVIVRTRAVVAQP